MLSITHHKIVTDNLESMYLLFITKSKTELLRKGETISLLNKFLLSLPPLPRVGVCCFFWYCIIKSVTVLWSPYSIKERVWIIPRCNIAWNIMSVKEWKQLIAEAAMYNMSDGLKNSTYKLMYQSQATSHSSINIYLHFCLLHSISFYFVYIYCNIYTATYIQPIYLSWPALVAVF